MYLEQCVEKINKRIAKNVSPVEQLIRNEICIEELLIYIYSQIDVNLTYYYGGFEETKLILALVGYQWVNNYLLANRDRLNILTELTLTEYEKSPEWKIKSRLLRSGYTRCQLCGGDKYSLNVHHNSYKNKPLERLEDLVVLCSDCHENFHIEIKRKHEYARNVISWVETL